jgi:hypothetical protein
MLQHSTRIANGLGPSFLPERDVLQHGELGPRPFAFLHVLSAGLTKQRTMSRWPTRAGMPFMRPDGSAFRRDRRKPATDASTFGPRYGRWTVRIRHFGA